MRALLALTLALLATAPPPAAADPAAERAAIATLRQAWAADLHDKRLEPSLARYTADAVFYNPDGSSAAGSAQIRALFEQVMRSWDSDLQFHSQALAVSGTLASDSGDYAETLTPRDGGPALHVQGTYLMVLRKGRDGRWRIRQQMWTARPPG